MSQVPYRLRYAARLNIKSNGVIQNVGTDIPEKHFRTKSVSGLHPILSVFFNILSPGIGTYSNFEIIIYSILFYPITLGGRRGTTDEFATIPFHLDLFSAALIELAKSIPVHSLILSSHLLFCLPLFLFPFTVPCRIVFAKPEDLETWPNHLSFRFLTRVRSSSYSPVFFNSLR